MPPRYVHHKSHMAHDSIILSDLGSALVEPYIGELWIATTANAVIKDSVQTGGEVGEDDEQDAGDIASRATHSAQAKWDQRKRAQRRTLRVVEPKQRIVEKERIAQNIRYLLISPDSTILVTL